MSRKNDLDWVSAMSRFTHHFGYNIWVPSHMNLLSKEDFKEFSDTIDKSIADDFDYTIEKYGTVKPKSFEKPDIYWD